jgi:hypothetical protein
MSDPPVVPPGGSPSMSSLTSVVDAVRPAGSAPRGPAIDVIFNLGGGHYRTHRLCPPGGPPSTSSLNSLVDAVRPPDSGPRGPAINVVFNLSGGRYQTRRQHPQGACH